MSVRKVGGIGTRKDGAGGESANLGEGAKFITVNVYSDDGNTADLTITKGDAVCMENPGTTNSHLTIGGATVQVVTHFGFGNVARLTDAAGRSAAIAGALGTIADAAFTFGIAAETVTISKDTSKEISVQVWGRCNNVNVAGTVAIGERLAAETAGADSSIGRLQDTDTLIGAALVADIREASDVAIVGIALSAASSNKSDVWLLDPLQLAN